MKDIRSLCFVGLVTLAAAGCGEAPQAAAAGASIAALSQEDCAAQLDACYRDNPLFGLISCPPQFAQCTAAAQRGLAKEVAAAVSEVAACTRTAAACASEVGNTEGTSQCTLNEAKCVASVVDVELPKVVEGTAKCVDGAVECVNGAENGRDLAGCGAALESCALEQAKSAVPPEVAIVAELERQGGHAAASTTVGHDPWQELRNVRV